MLRKAHHLIGFEIDALDGKMGCMDDIYFDDLTWIVRYMIVRTGPWFSRKCVMLSPTVVRDLLWQDRTLFVDLTKEQIEASPDLDLRKPVTREQEMELAHHFQWPSYWLVGPEGALDSATNLGTVAAMPGLGISAVSATSSEGSGQPSHVSDESSGTGVVDTNPGATNRADAILMTDDTLMTVDLSYESQSQTQAVLRHAAHMESHQNELRGVKAVTGYHIAATDGEIGHVSDFLINEENWHIRFLVVETSNWLSEKKVLLATDWITGILWEGARVHVNVTREQIESSPEYDPTYEVDRNLEERIFRHYGYPS